MMRWREAGKGPTIEGVLGLSGRIRTMMTKVEMVGAFSSRVLVCHHTSELYIQNLLLRPVFSTNHTMLIS